MFWCETLIAYYMQRPSAVTHETVAAGGSTPVAFSFAGAV